MQQFFADLIEDSTRDGTFPGVQELKDSILAHLEKRDCAPQPDRWKASGAKILTKIQRTSQALG